MNYKNIGEVNELQINYISWDEKPIICHLKLKNSMLLIYLIL